ncbi:Wzz/FepE/Etk N-terminal domain-containing protein [Thalassotalea euphylliae]|uniref:Wzz/FepE/Etk N-terminal domain-containing protein n=1 Tax=Thalassotalea euphylliae TaxID=1655234 RepID=UPI0015F2652A|nr:Wzz/FepE/Etk N-terminal domain-containing protein [Thalassotalea euphylliae]
MSVHHENEFIFYALLKYIWSKKFSVIGFVTLIIVLTTIWLVSLPNIYKSTVLVTPTQEATGSGLTSMGAQLGGLASLAGINISGGSNDKVAIALQVLESRKFILNFIEKYNIDIPLIASNAWDQKNNKLEINPEIYNSNTKTWTRKDSSGNLAPPTSIELYNKFLKLLTIDNAVSTGSVTVSVEHLSPHLALAWTEALITELNATMRDRDIKSTTLSISYLENQIAKTQNADMQKIFYQLVQEQTKTLMIAEVTPEYVFEVIDPAFLPLEKSAPKRALMLIAATFLAGLLALFFCILCFFVIPRKHSAH